MVSSVFLYLLNTSIFKWNLFLHVYIDNNLYTYISIKIYKIIIEIYKIIIGINHLYIMNREVCL